jgi:hypothetical protein
VSDHDPWPWLADGGITRGELRTWGSVLTSAFDLVRRMGCSPIVFAGADLAFSGERPYCRGTIYDAVWQEWIDKGCTWEQLMEDYFRRQPEVWLDDVAAQRVRTAPHLVSFRNWLVEQAGRDASSAVINATGRGILHGGVITQRTLTDVFDSRPAIAAAAATLRHLHTTAVRARGDLERLQALMTLAAADPATVPVARWQQFAASTLTADEIVAALPVSDPDDRPTTGVGPSTGLS